MVPLVRTRAKNNILCWYAVRLLPATHLSVGLFCVLQMAASISSPLDDGFLIVVLGGETLGKMQPDKRELIRGLGGSVLIDSGSLQPACNPSEPC